MAAKQTLGLALVWLGRVAVSGTFIYAAALKIGDPQAFVADIGHYRLISYPFTLALSIYLPWLEFVCGAAVLLRHFDRGALLILTALCGLFAIALVSARLRGLDIDCGCFGHSDRSTSTAFAIVRVVFLGSISLALLIRNDFRKQCAD